MKQKLIAGNWKMNGSKELIQQMIDGLKASVDLNNPPSRIAICAPFVLLESLKSAVAGLSIEVGAQNVHQEAAGAYTGEISVGLLKELGMDYTIVGHSERRQYFGETDELIGTKALKLLDAGITPIVCVGETLEQREANQHESTVINQFKGCFANFSEEQLCKTVIAYEPVWAIGTGKTASNEQANSMHEVIRKQLTERVGAEKAAEIYILYGGSVNGGNANGLMSQAEIDGGLVGGASLKPQDFAKIIAWQS